MKRAWSLCLASVLAAGVVVGVTAATAATGKPIDVGTKHASVDVEKGSFRSPLRHSHRRRVRRHSGAPRSTAASAKVGDRRSS